jgi:hypothetical protein
MLTILSSGEARQSSRDEMICLCGANRVALNLRAYDFKSSADKVRVRLKRLFDMRRRRASWLSRDAVLLEERRVRFVAALDVLDEPLTQEVHHIDRQEEAILIEALLEVSDLRDEVLMLFLVGLSLRVAELIEVGFLGAEMNHRVLHQPIYQLAHDFFAPAAGHGVVQRIDHLHKLLML